MRQRIRPHRGTWNILQASIVVGLAVVLVGLALRAGDDPRPAEPHRLGPAGPASLVDSLHHDLDNCRAVLDAGGSVEDC